MNKIKIILVTCFTMFVALFVFQACKHKTEKEGMIGPAYMPPSDNFKIEGDSFVISNNKPNFSRNYSSSFVSSDLATITATFSEKVTWYLSFKGLSSSAKHKVSGLSQTINYTWNGISDSLYFFKKGESVEITLSFFGTDKFTVKDTLVISDVFKYAGKMTPSAYEPLVINGIVYHFVDDLEVPSDTNTKLSNISQDQADVKCATCFNQKDSDNPVQGSYSYLLSGKDDNQNTYIASMNTDKLYGLAKRITSGTTEDKLFINFYVYGDGKNPNTSMQVIAYEMDSVAFSKTGTREIEGWPCPSFSPVNTGSKIGDPTRTLLTSFNNPTTQQKASGKNGNVDKWSTTIAVNWTGWKLVSVKYSDLKKPTTDGLMGDGRKQPERLSGIAFSLDSQAGGTGLFKIDQVTVTENAPFKQQ